MAASRPDQPPSLMTLPRELRNEIIGYLTLPNFVYTSSDKPNTSNLHLVKGQAKTYVDTRIYVPCRLSPSLLGVCQQLRQESLQHHVHLLESPIPHTIARDNRCEKPPSSVLAERLGTESNEAVERLGDHSVRITLEADTAQRGRFGYFQPIREEVSPRFLGLLPLMERVKRLRLVVWPGYDWWNGQRPRAVRRVKGHLQHVEQSHSDAELLKPDVVSLAIGKILERFPAVEELSIDVLILVNDVARWDLPDQKWDNIQYWLDGPVTRDYPLTVRKVVRRLAVAWIPPVEEAFFTQVETRLGEGKTWRIKRRGDMRTVSRL